MEVIVRGEGWEKKVQAADIDDALDSLAGWGYVSKVYTVSDDGGKTERRVQWDRKKRRSFPACDPTARGGRLAAGCGPKVSDEEITDSIVAENGIIRRAARMVGIDPQAFANRIDRNPHLWPVGVVRPRREKVSREEVTTAISAASGDLSRAAEILGVVGRDAVMHRVRRNPEIWPHDAPMPERLAADLAQRAKRPPGE